MKIPECFQKEVAALPPVLQALLETELAAGNEITRVGHSFPAPPIGAYFLLARPITTRARISGDGLRFRNFGSSLYSGEFTDSEGNYFILEPPLPRPPEPDMDAIRRAASAPRPKQKREITPETPYRVELDAKGEMLTYHECDRYTEVDCSFGRKVVLSLRTLRDWWYPHERRQQAMTAAEKNLVIQRLVDYCRDEQGVARIELDDGR